MSNDYMLAMYDIRGKQDYIFRSGKLKEIMGGSAVIRDCFNDYFFKSADQYSGRANSVFNYRTEADTAFDRNSFEKRINSGFIGEVIYDGGGNFLVLFKDRESCIGVNKLFTKAVMEAAYSLRVLCTFIDGVDFDDYKGDRERLYDMHRVRESADTGCAPAQVLPFTQTDRRTSMPIYKKNYNGIKEVTKESFCKYEKYNEMLEVHSGEFGEKMLDNLVTKRGEESLLAVVYIDGNNMGASVKECLEGRTDYESCIAELRSFSDRIQKNFVTDRMADIDKMLADKYGVSRRRFVVYAGDEINFICNARDAYDLARVYLTGLPEGFSACAGIAVFHSHAPYHEAYRIAEECCESGKKEMKRRGLSDVCLIDAHYCQGGIGVDLETIREEETGGRVSRPWFVSAPAGSVEEYRRIASLDAMAEQLNKIARTNVKSLAAHAKNSIPNLKMEIERINAHLPDMKNGPDWHLAGLLGGCGLTDDEMSRLIYDAVIFYDLWFRGNGGTDNAE